MNRRLRRAPDGDEPDCVRSPRPKAIAGAACTTAMPPRRCRARDRARSGT